MRNINKLKEEVIKLKEITGMGMLDCKKALEVTDYDFDKAKKLLEERWESIKRISLVTYR